MFSVSRPVTTQFAGLISTGEPEKEQEPEEVTSSVSKQKPDFKIKVSEEKDSIPN
ncbi:MAG: hypothetical protein JNL60_16830 [Bacteroidia bacterium]|nr:hypothetical protein [Bacteroidia bacterium]